MKARYWILPVSMLIGSWIHALICEQFPPNNKLFPSLMTLLLFALTALLLNRTCTRRTVLISATWLLVFCLLLTVLVLTGANSQFCLGLAYLWEVLFFPYLSLPLPDVSYSLTFLLPALIPFAWSLSCKSF